MKCLPRCNHMLVFYIGLKRAQQDTSIKASLTGHKRTTSGFNKLITNEHIPDRLFSLCLPHFRLLVALSKDIAERSAGDGALELHRTPCTFLLYLFLHSLLVLASIQNCPVHLARVALRLVQLGAFGIYEVERL